MSCEFVDENLVIVSGKLNKEGLTLIDVSDVKNMKII